MAKDKAALFVLFSVLTYVPLANAQLPDCEKATTSAIAGQGRYAVYCDGELQKNDYDQDSFTESEANAIILNKELEAQKYQDNKAIYQALDENQKARDEGRPEPYPGLENPDESNGPFSD